MSCKWVLVAFTVLNCVEFKLGYKVKVMVSVLLIDDDAELSKLLEEYCRVSSLSWTPRMMAEAGWKKPLTTSMPW